MEVNIKVVDGVLEFKALHVITESQCNKIKAGINKQRIVKWCDDNHVSVDTERSIQSICVMTQARREVDTNTISEMERKMHEFLMFVDDLPEVDSPDDKGGQPIDETVKECLKFAKDVITGIDEGDIDGCTIVSEIGPLVLPCGHMSKDMLRELLVLYIDKYDNKAN